MHRRQYLPGLRPATRRSIELENLRLKRSIGYAESDRDSARAAVRAWQAGTLLVRLRRLVQKVEVIFRAIFSGNRQQQEVT